MKNWLMSNIAGLVALGLALVLALLLAAAHTRCSLMEDKIAALEAQLGEEVSGIKVETANQAKNHIAVLDTIDETLKRLGPYLQKIDAQPTEEVPGS